VRVLRAALFDLDGVLIDSVESITSSMRHALVALGHPPRTREELKRFVGPQLEESAATLLASEEPEAIARWVKAYRDHYDVHCVAQTCPAAGLGEVVPALAARLPLAVATNKPEVYAERLLRAFGVRAHFRVLAGRTLALDRETKTQVIGRALAGLGLPDGSEAVMVGDRRHDVLGAAAHGMPTIGVLHGAGDEAELRAAGARWIVPDLRAAARLIHEMNGSDPRFSRSSRR
jgi:phosphoglycolate phosphatase